MAGTTTLHPRRARMEHGTVAGYRGGCREDCCKPAGVAAAKEYRRWRHLNPGVGRRCTVTGTRRRLLALAWLGYTQREIAAMIGTTQRTISRITTGEVAEVYAATAQRVEALFDHLGAQPPPRMTGARARARAYARRLPEAAPPLAWDDDEIDDPAARPYVPPPPVPTGTAERAAYEAQVFVDEVQQMYETGRTLAAIASARGVTPKAIIRRLERWDAAWLARALTGHAALKGSDEEATA